MESFRVLQALLSGLEVGADVAQIALVYILFRFHTRLTKLETKIEILQNAS